MPSPPDENPFAALEEAAARQGAAEHAAKLLAGARARLVLGRDARSVFFACLALRLKPVVTWDIPTMATDGKTLEYNPEFVVGLSADELLGVVAHEVMHNALAHHCRRGTRDPGRWNEACDLAVNPVLAGAGFSLPKGRLMPGEGRYADMPVGLAAEAYYGMLPQPLDGQPAEERGQDPGGCGAVKEPGQGSPAEAADQQAAWEAAVVQAERAAAARGELPAGLARSVEQVLHPPADWRAVLREFVSSTARNDYSWTRPNRRFIAQGLYLPGLRSEELGEVVVAVDTSGSVGAAELAVFGAELDALLGAFDCTATIVYHDAAITHMQEWAPADGPLVHKPKGGGGTSHVPVFDWVREHAQSPACIVCLTDLETEFPDAVPDVPVLWGVVGGNQSVPPFGRAVPISA
jgi:predicted metal-dependent peptidase